MTSAMKNLINACNDENPSAAQRYIDQRLLFGRTFGLGNSDRIDKKILHEANNEISPCKNLEMFQTLFERPLFLKSVTKDCKKSCLEEFINSGKNLGEFIKSHL